MIQIPSFSQRVVKSPEVPSILDILNQSGEFLDGDFKKCNLEGRFTKMRDIANSDKWYLLFNECVSCCLNRNSELGREYREKFRDSAVEQIVDGVIIMELMPGMLLTDLDILVHLDSEKVRNLTLVHYCPNIDHYKIVEDYLSLSPENTLENYQERFDLQYLNDRSAWGYMEILRRQLLIDYASLKGINLTIRVVNTDTALFKERGISLCIAMDYVDNGIWTLVHFSRICFETVHFENSLRIHSCRTDCFKTIYYCEFVIDHDICRKNWKLINPVREKTVTLQEELEKYYRVEEHEPLNMQDFSNLLKMNSEEMLNQTAKLNEIVKNDEKLGLFKTSIGDKVSKYYYIDRENYLRVEKELKELREERNKLSIFDVPEFFNASEDEIMSGNLTQETKDRGLIKIEKVCLIDSEM